MKTIRPAFGSVTWALMATFLVFAAGCSTTIERPLTDDQNGVVELDHGYTLLDSLLSDESSVADILVIKSAGEDLSRLLKNISKLAKSDLAEIRKLYSMDPSIDPSGDGLPRIEADARARIRNQQTKLLIMSGGEEFEVLILLTQEKATDYIESICRSLSKADPQEQRSRMLAGMADGWMELNRRARSLFLIKDDVEIPNDKD